MAPDTIKGENTAIHDHVATTPIPSSLSVIKIRVRTSNNPITKM
jgi:hypothetical protein